MSCHPGPAPLQFWAGLPRGRPLGLLLFARFAMVIAPDKIDRNNPAWEPAAIRALAHSARVLTARLQKGIDRGGGLSGEAWDVLHAARAIGSWAEKASGSPDAPGAPEVADAAQEKVG